MRPEWWPGRRDSVREDAGVDAPLHRLAAARPWGAGSAPTRSQDGPWVRVLTWSTAWAAHSWSVRRGGQPGGLVKTYPGMGGPVESIGRAVGGCRALAWRAVGSA